MSSVAHVTVWIEHMELNFGNSKGKECTLEQTMKAQVRIRGVALLFL